MRNLNEHPVTHDEIIECLQRYREAALAEGRIGDMRPMLLTAAINHIISNKIYALDIFGKIGNVGNVVG